MDSNCAADVADVAAARAGDPQAFERLVVRHRRLVTLVVLDHVRRPDDLADCVQETFLRALRDLAALREPARFPAWLRSIARNVAIDHRRRRADDLRRSVVGLESLDELPGRERSPSQAVVDQHLVHLVRSAVRALPEREATALWLAAFDDRRPAEIASVLGTTVGNAKVITHRARRRLRAALTEYAHAQGHERGAAGAVSGSSERADPMASCPTCDTSTYRSLQAAG